MSTLYFVSAGASKRCNIMVNIGKIIIYASCSNIVLVDVDRKVNVIVRDIKDELTFLCTKNEHVIVCDVTGNIEVYQILDNLDYILLSSFCISKVLFGAILTEKDKSFVGIGLDSIFYIENSNIIKNIQVDNLLTTLCPAYIRKNEFYIFGYNNGSVDVYDLNLECQMSKQIHKDAIKCLKFRSIDGEACFITSSLDFTVRISKVSFDSTNKLELINLYVCYGHSGWVNGCNWVDNNKIITCSSDNNLIIWENKGNKFLIDNKLGGLKEKNKTFYSCLEIEGDIFVQSISGGIYRYMRNNLKLENFVSGHVGEITSMDVYKDMILTTSLDYTSRIYSFALKEEISRPQIHGYPIICAKFHTKNPLQIISGADETVIRILKSTQLFIMNYINLLNKLKSDQCALNNLQEYVLELNNDSIASLPKMARLAELSLTTETFDQNYKDTLEEGNNERNLSINFLFAEEKKLYGHFFEIADIAISDKYIISANKATNIKFSGIFVWNHSYEKVDYIPVHRLGIQRLKFSNDGKYIIACSRDTSVSLYELINERFVHKTTFNAHSRIVWDCDISFDNRLAVSVSRDKKLCIYDVELLKELNIHVFKHEITAVCFHKNINILCIGFSNGYIEIFKIYECFQSLISKRVHSSIVKCVSFVNYGFLCSGGEDGMLVINNFSDYF